MIEMFRFLQNQGEFLDGICSFLCRIIAMSIAFTDGFDKFECLLRYWFVGSHQTQRWQQVIITRWCAWRSGSSFTFSRGCWWRIWSRWSGHESAWIRQKVSKRESQKCFSENRLLGHKLQWICHADWNETTYWKQITKLHGSIVSIE